MFDESELPEPEKPLEFGAPDTVSRHDLVAGVRVEFGTKGDPHHLKVADSPEVRLTVEYLAQSSKRDG
jgi:hypothetical protein